MRAIVPEQPQLPVKAPHKKVKIVVVVDVGKDRVSIRTDINDRKKILRLKLKIRRSCRPDILVIPEPVPTHVIQHSVEKVEVAVPVDIGKCCLVKTGCHQ